MNPNDQQVKHLEFIQGIVSRLNSNSFQLKGWVVTLVSAPLALYASVKNDHFILVAIVPSVLMWFLDAYYLMQERKFRGLYNDIAGVSTEPKDIKPFEMRPDLYKGKKYSYCSSFFSPTIAGLYLPMVIGLVILFFTLHCN